MLATRLRRLGYLAATVVLVLVTLALWGVGYGEVQDIDYGELPPDALPVIGRTKTERGLVRYSVTCTTQRAVFPLRNARPCDLGGSQLRSS